MSNVNKEINQNLKNLLNPTERRSSNIDSLQSREYLQKRQEQSEIQNEAQNQNMASSIESKNDREAIKEQKKADNSSSVFSVRIKNSDVVALKQALKKQGINNFSTGLRTIIYKYMEDNNIL